MQAVGRVLTDRRPQRAFPARAFPARADTRLAGLLLAVPDLVALDLPALARAAGYPGTRVIPAVSWLGAQVQAAVGPVAA